jgi:hypothetical protein
VSGAAAALARVWFAPGRPRALAAARIIVSAYALWVLLSRDLAALSALPAELWSTVAPSARLRYLLFPGRPLLEGALQAAAAVALLGALLGVAARACCAAAGLLLYHLAPLETLFLTPAPFSKGFTLAVPALLVLAATPSDHALALRPARARLAPDAYGWPVRLLQLLVCQAYFFAGVAKLWWAGPGWASADNMRAWLLLSNLDPQMGAWPAGGLWLADRPAACAVMGVLALALELVFPAALFSTRARRVLVPAAALFHAAILATLGYAFLYLPLLLLFVDWGAGRAGADGAAAGPGGDGRAVAA